MPTKRGGESPPMPSLIDIHCAISYCGQLVGKAAPGSVVETVCKRCYSIILWNDGEVTVTRPPRRVRDKSGRWRTVESSSEIDKIMRERSAVEGANVRHPRR